MSAANAKPRIKREIRELSLLFEISRLLDRSMDLRDVLRPVLRALGEHMGIVVSGGGESASAMPVATPV